MDARRVALAASGVGEEDAINICRDRSDRLDHAVRWGVPKRNLSNDLDLWVRVSHVSGQGGNDPFVLGETAFREAAVAEKSLRLQVDQRNERPPHAFVRGSFDIRLA